MYKRHINSIIIIIIIIRAYNDAGGFRVSRLYF